ncbi:MAG: hypothetical protein PHW04_05285 [Candidatus Wallbacteria bacterium]|nr:hypothetical protein [Candidatus Wallbacteria bacterium]
MKKTYHPSEESFFLLAILLLFILSDCVPPKSISPLFTDKNLIFEDRLIGNWLLETDKNSGNFTITKAGEKSYSMVMTEKDSGTSAKADLHMIAMGIRKYARKAENNNSPLPLVKGRSLSAALRGLKNCSSPFTSSRPATVSKHNRGSVH